MDDLKNSILLLEKELNRIKSSVTLQEITIPENIPPTTNNEDILLNSSNEHTKDISNTNSDYIIKNIDVTPFTHPKFQKRMIIREKYQSDICEWFLFEMNNYKKHNPTKSRIQVEDVPNLFNFTIISLQKILKKMSLWYDLENHIKLNILDIYFDKSEEDDTAQDSDFTIKIPFDEELDILFEDGINTSLKKGDTIVYKSDVKYKYSNVNTNTTFMIVKIKIINEINI